MNELRVTSELSRCRTRIDVLKERMEAKMEANLHQRIL